MPENSRMRCHYRTSLHCAALATLMSVVPNSSYGAVVDANVALVIPSEFAGAVQSGLGFSFRYGGMIVGPSLPKDWRAVELNDRVSLTHDSGLVVTRTVRHFPEFNAIEYSVSFKNATQRTLPAISQLSALDLAFENSPSDEVCVVSSGGGLMDSFLPPRTFAIRENCFAPTVRSAGFLELTTEGGRSSNKDLPFFFVQNKTVEAGIFVAFGWSGQWQASVTHNAQWDLVAPSAPAEVGILNLKGKIPDVSVELEPGEEIAGPTILVGLYKGGLSEGSNRLRRLIRERYTPKLSGQRALPMAVFNPYWNVGADFNEALLKRQAVGAAGIDQEYFTLDAGWFAGAGKTFSGFSAGLGNWDEIDRSKLPHGLRGIASFVRSKGLKFGLWFEPERVAPGSQLAVAHPSWVLWKREEWPETGFSEWNRGFGVLDYGRPEVQEWVRNMLDRYILDYDLKLVRYDFNIDPLQYWAANDAPNRRGLTQLRHIRGLYAVIDWLRERHPDVVFDGCASGGRRIDLETARRFHIFSISDYNVDPAIMRFHLFGINHFLPGNYHKLEYILPLPHDYGFQADDLGFQSLFAGAAGTGGRVDLWPEEMKRKAKLHVKTWKSLRRYLVEDYYPLSSQPGDLKTWSGWQFHDPMEQSGFIQAFRTKTPDSRHRFNVRGLEERSRYLFSDAYGGETIEISGSQAMTEGIEVALEPMTSTVYVYRRIADERQISEQGALSEASTSSSVPVKQAR